MNDPEAPIFQWGQPVLAAQDLFNDGSYPDQPPDALLVRTGERGEVVQIGAHVETRTAIYLVEFSGRRVIGCLQDEIRPAELPGPILSEESQSR